jgi:serine/threonine protein phosphatase 1
MYQKINGSDFARIFVVGDIHGCLYKLNEKLLSVDFDEDKDLLVSVGDLIDRGPQNVECLDLINESWFRAVRGNHEQMAIDTLNGQDARHWIANGGMWLFSLDYDQRILAEQLIRKAEKLPLVIEVETVEGKFVICHADYPDNAYEFGKPVSEQHLIWNRERISSAIDGEGDEITGARLFIFGHTPMQNKFEFINQMWIDTGAVFGHSLTMIQIQ